MRAARIVSRCTDKDPGFVLMRLRMLVNDHGSWVRRLGYYIHMYTHTHTCWSFAPSRQLRELLLHRPDISFGIAVMKANPRI